MLSQRKLSGPILHFAAVGALVTGAWLGRAQAEPRPVVPDNCPADALLVSRGDGRFECRAPQEALHLAFCRDGDMIVTDAFGRLKCERPSVALPRCSSGEILVSAGSGEWRCAEHSHK